MVLPWYLPGSAHSVTERCKARRQLMQFEEKVALITGGAVRVGRAIALRLAQDGCDIIIHYRHSIADANSLAEELRSMGRQAWLMQGDLYEAEETESLFRSAWEMSGWIDLLVNNASTYSREPLLEAEEADFDLHWRVNALAPMLLTKTFANCVNESDILPDDFQGQVINILDRKVANPDIGALPYWISKSALASFTMAAAKELAPDIAVNGIAPGPVLPPVETGTNSSPDPAGYLPLEVPCRPQDVADAVAYLSASRCITGQIIFVDSGQHLFQT